jgi:hypothetical protein
MLKLIFTLLLGGLLTIPANAQDFQKYTFPINPNDTSWKSNNYAQRVKLLDIEESKVKKLSNKQLIGAVLEYPYTINVFAFNTIEDGYQNVYLNFSGLRELHNRQNIGDDLIFFYKCIGIEGYDEELESFNSTYNILTLSFFEILLSQRDLLDKLNIEQKRKLIDTCIDKYYAKENDTRTYENEPIFSNLSKKQSLFIACQLLLMDGNESSKNAAKEFIDSKSFSKPEIDKLISISTKLY